MALLLYARSVVLGLGVNDIGAGRSLATIKSDLISLWHLARDHLQAGGRVIQTTITPSCTSTDNFATLANQSAAANFSTSGNGTREQLNDWLRDGAPIVSGAAASVGSSPALRAGDAAHPIHAVLDMADAVESARNSGRWRVDGNAAKWTADGLHPTSFAHKEAAASSASFLSFFD